MLRELRLALRSNLRDRGHAATVILTLMVATAANSLTFAVVNSVLLRPLPVPNADEIVLMANRYPKAGAGDDNQSGPGDFVDRLRDVHSLTDQALFHHRDQTLDRNGTAERVSGMAVTPSFFGLVRTSPALGRAFTPEEGELGAERKVILSHGLWQQLYAGRREAIGQDLGLGGRPYTVVGVMPPNFNFVSPEARLWVPLAFTAEEKQRHHSNNFFHAGRLKLGVTLAQVQAQVDAVNRANLEREPQLREALTNAGFHTQVEPLTRMMVRSVKGVLYLLWAAAILVLLIGGLNVANLSLARLAARRKEVATRLALGASRMQLARQSILESCLLTSLGGILGVAAAYGLLPLLALIGLDRFPRAGEVRIDLAVALVSLAMGLTVGIAVGLLPLLSFPASLNNALRDDQRAGTGSVRSRRLRQWLVAAEVGFAFVLLVGAGLLLASFRHLLAVDPGFSGAGVYTAATSAPSSRYTNAVQVRGLLNRTLEAARRLPGVTAAGATTIIPLSGDQNDGVIIAEGHEMKPGESVIAPQRAEVSPGYFEAMGIRVLRGRNFDGRDHETSEPVIMIDQLLARHFWPNRDPVGQRMYTPNDPAKMRPDANTRWLRVIGVVRSIRLDDLADRGKAIGAYYFPLAQSPSGGFVLALKTQPGFADPIRALRGEIARIDPQLALFDIHSMTERAELSLSSRRTALLLALTFGSLALFLSALGIYGVLAYLVTQRRREIGIRVALGSSAAGVVRLVLREGLVLVGTGLALGLLGTVAMQRAVAKEIYGVQPLDPTVIAAVVCVLAAIGMMACLVPARRALAVNPAIVLSE